MILESHFIESWGRNKFLELVNLLLGARETCSIRKKIQDDTNLFDNNEAF